jgi:NitT/TauT family transport system ATP-binding protein
MDEPFSALDIQTRNMMENELLELWAETRKTVLFVTHDIEEAISLSDRVLVLTRNPGSIKSEYEVELGRPRNVTEVRFEKTFSEVYERIWEDLKEEVILSYEESKRK